MILVGESYFSLDDLFSKKNYDIEALDHYLKAEKIWLQHLSDSHFRFSQLYHAIGQVYGYVKGDFIVARTFLEKALQIELNHLKATNQLESIFLGKIYNSLGKNCHSCGRYKEALTYYGKSLIIFERTLSSTHVDLSNLFSSYAETYQDLGDHVLALTYYERALDTLLRQKAASLNQEAISDVYGNIGAVHLQNGSYKEAVKYCEKEMNTKLEIMTYQSPDLIVTYTNLGHAYTALSDFTVALQYLNRALDIAQATLPKYHENLASIYNKMASAYSEQGNPNQALEYARLSLDVQLNCLPSDHPSFATIYNNLTCIYTSMLDYDESLKNYKLARTIFQKHQPENDPVLIAVNANIGLSWHQLGYLDRAEGFLEQSLTILRSTYDKDGDHHFKFAFTYNTTVCLLSNVLKVHSNKPNIFVKKGSICV